MSKARTPSIPVQFGHEFDPVDLIPAKLVKQNRYLRYNYNALAELQDVAGTYKSEVASLKAMRAVVWAGLLAETLDGDGRETARTLSLCDVGEILADMEKAEIDELVSSVMEARGIADPPVDPTPATAPTPQA